MKNTGMTRRIDELGRIVIPKEIREAFKLKVGAPLEIYIEDDCIMLKKHSQILFGGDNVEFIVKSLFEATGQSVVLFDLDKVLFAFGKAGREIVGSPMSSELYEKIGARRMFDSDKEAVARMFQNDEVGSATFCPILTGGDLLGCLCLIQTKNEVVSESDKRLLSLCSDLMQRQLT